MLFFLKWKQNFNDEMKRVRCLKLGVNIRKTKSIDQNQPNKRQSVREEEELS